MLSRGKKIRLLLRAIFPSFTHILLPLSLFAQESSGNIENLVPNGDFELFSQRPIGWYYNGKDFSDVMKYWDSPTAASPDAYGPEVSVPAHWADKGFGSQTPQSGQRMVGITCYGCVNGKPHCREYLQVQLLEPLVIGQQYYLEFWISRLPQSLSVNNIGAAFSEIPLHKLTDEVLSLEPTIKASKIVSAPAKKWVKLSSSFLAKEPADYLLIGNFFEDKKTKSKAMASEVFGYAYYYIDNVLLKKLAPILPVPENGDDISKAVIEEGKIIPLKNIFFEFDKDELLPRSYLELRKLLRLLKKHPSMVIEIRGHTDNWGDDAYNKDLSNRRAKKVVEYLNLRGIDEERTRYKGFGAEMPIATNKTDRGRQLNRRVEFLILKK